MLFWRTLKADLRRGIQSPMMWSAIVIMILFTMFPLINFMRKLEGLSVIDIIEYSIRGDGISTITWSLIPTLGIPLALATDIEEGASTFWAMRCGQRKYILSKLIAAGCSGFFVHFIMFSILELALSFQLPVIPSRLDTGFMFPVFVSNAPGIIWGYFLVNIYLSLSGFWAGYTAVAFSAFIPNRFAAMASPTLLYVFILRISGGAVYTPNMTLFDEMCEINYISWSTFYTTDNVFTAIAAKSIMIFVLCLIMGAAAVWYRERRLGGNA